MTVTNVAALSLGVVEREATETKRAWSALDFVVVGESSSRRTFIDRQKEAALLNEVRTICSEWGSSFLFDGEVSANGAVKITAVYDSL